MTFRKSLGIASRAARAFEVSMAAVRRLERLRPRALNGSFVAHIDAADAWGSGASGVASLPLYAGAAGAPVYRRLFAGASVYAKPYAGAGHAGGGNASHAAFSSLQRAESATRGYALFNTGGGIRSGILRLSASMEGGESSGLQGMAYGGASGGVAGGVYGGVRGALLGHAAAGTGAARAASRANEVLAGGARNALMSAAARPYSGTPGNGAAARWGFAGMPNPVMTTPHWANSAYERAVSPGSAYVVPGLSAMGAGSSLRGAGVGRAPLTARLALTGAGGVGAFAGMGGVHSGVTARGMLSRMGMSHAQAHGAFAEGVRTRAALERYRTTGYIAPFMGMEAARAEVLSARMTSRAAYGGSEQGAADIGAAQGLSRTAVRAPGGSTAARRLNTVTGVPGVSAADAVMRRVERGARIGMGEAGEYLSPGELNAMLETASAGKGGYCLTIEGGGGASGCVPAASAAPAAVDEDALAAHLAERIRRESRMAASGVYGMSRR